MRARRLAELRVQLIAGERVLAALRRVCDVQPALPGSGEDAEAADLLLVETGAGTDPEAIGDAVERARGARRPAAAWLTRHVDVLEFPTEVLDLFDRVFVTDPSAMKELARRTARPVWILPLAASAVPGDTPVAGGDRVGYVGGFSAAWSEGGREFAEALLHAALPYGLDILPQPDEYLSLLPDRFQACVRRGVALDRSLEPLQRCRTLIVYVPKGTPPSVPGIVLDALAMGVLVVMRSSEAWQLLPPKLIAYVRTPPLAPERLAWCMRQGDEQRERSCAGRAAVLNAHSHAARLATVASSFGMTVLPEPGAS